MPSGNTTIRSRVNPSKFMGSAHAAGEELEERVSNNERKITLIKNILNYQDSLLPIPKPEEDDGDDSSNLNIADRLDNIGDALGVIGGLFKLQLSSLQDKEEQDRKAKADQDKRDRESALEAKKATKSKKKTPLQKGALGFFDRLKKFFLNVAIGAGALKLLEWLRNPENKEKIEKFTNWLTDNADSIFKWILAIVAIDIGTKILGLIGAGGIIWKLLAKLKLLPIVIGTILFTIPRFFGKEGGTRLKDLQPYERRVILKLREMPGGNNAENRNKLYEIIEKQRDEANILDKMQYTEQMKFLKGDRIKEFSVGGRPPVGEVISVGEEGRELFVADRSGTIVSNDKTEHVFNDGALLVAKSNTLDKISNTSSIVAKSDTLSNKSSSISQRVNNKHGSSKIIDLRGGQQQGSTFTAGNATTGNQIEGVSSVFPGDILVKAAQVQLGLVG